jgi:hypothetical protein
MHFLNGRLGGGQINHGHQAELGAAFHSTEIFP